jgi:hypothetical protein
MPNPSTVVTRYRYSLPWQWKTPKKWKSPREKKHPKQNAGFSIVMFDGIL